MINSYDIVGIGTEISNKLKEKHLKDNRLIIQLEKNVFTKLDEDLYYRQNPNEKTFIPSDDEIKLVFDNLELIIQKN